MPVAFPNLPGGLLYRTLIHSESGQGMELFIVREGGPLAAGMFQQAAEIVQLAVRLWSQQHDKAVISELVKAIMKDEPMKMRRLADLFHIDVASIHAMWIAASGSGSGGFPPDSPDMVRDMARQYCKTSFADIYEGCLVVFMDGPRSLQDADTLRQAILAQLPTGATLTMFRNLKNTAAVRESYLANRDCVADAKRIFPGRTCFSGDEISFVKSCRQRIARGEAFVAEALSALWPLESERETDELKRTLAVYLLDTGSNLSATAEKLFLHKNTIKYRLKIMSDRFGFRVGSMPASQGLYEAVAIERLLRSDE